MRLVVTLGVILGIAGVGAKEVIIPMTLERLPDEQVERQFDQLKRSVKATPVHKPWPIDTEKINRLRIRGGLPPAELGQLLKDARKVRMQYLWQNGDESWNVQVTVVGQFSKVQYFFSCGEICAQDVDLVFQKKDGTWKYIYKLGPYIH